MATFNKDFIVKNGLIVQSSNSSTITASAASSIGLIIKGFTSQSADYLQVQNSSSTVVFKVDSSNSVAVPFGQISAASGLVGAGTTRLGTAGVTAYASAATSNGIVVRGFASQTANLQEWQDSAGTILARVNNTGQIQAARFIITGNGQINNDTGTNGGILAFGSTGLLATALAATQIGFAVRGAASQSANLTEWQDSASTVLASVSNTGRITAANGFVTPNVGLFGASSGGLATLTSYTAAAGTIGIAVRGAASQTADLIQAQNSAGSVVFKVSPTGVINAGGATTIGNVLNFSDPGIAVETRFNFLRATDSAWLAINEMSSDSTYYEFGMADNPSGGDYFQWRFDNWEGPSYGWMPMQMSGYLNRFTAASNTMYGNFALPYNTPYANINNAAFNAATINVNKYTPTQNTTQSLFKDAGTGTGTVTLNAQSFTGSARTQYWIEIETGATTFKWGNGVAGATPVATGVVITGSAQTLNNGVTVTISTTGHVIGDRWSFVSNPRNTVAIGGSPITGAMEIIYPSAALVGTVIRGASGQTADLQQWQNSAGTILSGITSNGYIFAGSSYSGGWLSVTPPISTERGIVVRGATSQSADLQQWQNAGATVLSKVDASGNITAASFVRTSGTSAQFLKADGTVDSSTYLTTATASSTYAPINNPTFTGSVTLPGSPSLALQAATKQYVDDVAQGLHIHASTVAATTANLTATYSNGTAGVGATLTNSGTLAAFSVDDVSPAQNARVLVKNQTTQLQNGVYTLTTVGSGSVAWVLTRATDMDQSAEVQGGDFVFVTGGTANDNTGWVQTETSVTIGTNNIIFTQFSGAGTYTAGNGLTLTGSVFSINTSITADLSTAQTFTNKTINGSNNTITNVSLTTGVTGTLPVANGGTGITSFGTGIATFLGTPSSANLKAAVTDETGSGALVFADSPAFIGAITFGDGTTIEGRMTSSGDTFYVQAGNNNADTTAKLNIARNGTTSATISQLNIYSDASTFFGPLTTTGTVSINTAGTGTINLGDGTITKASGSGFTFNSSLAAPALSGSLLSSTVGTALGTAAAGTATIPARADHVHPTTGLALLAGATFTGQIQSTLANSTTTGGGQIYLNGATGNRIDFNQNGVAAPTFTTRSVGTKIVLYPDLTASSADYALGIEGNTLWSSIPSTTQQFRWYGGTTLAATLTGAGAFSAVTKSFDIEHPTKEGMRLRYGSLEGPENGVYVRGKSKGKTIELPDYWTGLIDEETITVNLTAIGSGTLYVKEIIDNTVIVGGTAKEYFFTVYGERKDVDKLLVEY